MLRLENPRSGANVGHENRLGFQPSAQDDKRIGVILSEAKDLLHFSWEQCLSSSRDADSIQWKKPSPMGGRAPGKQSNELAFPFGEGGSPKG